MKQYHDMLRYILDNGVEEQTRAKLASTGENIGALTVFGYQMRFDLSKGFPLLTTKRLSFHNILHELLWMISGSTNIKYLEDNNVHIWRQWADENLELGPTYGKQFRNIEKVYQVEPLLFDEYQPEIIKVSDNILDIKYCDDSKLVGKNGVNTQGEEFTVIDRVTKCGGDRHAKFLVYFHSTGHVDYFDYCNVMYNKPKDKWFPSVFGVGCYGDCDETDPYYEILFDCWRSLLRRCYCKKSTGYKSYGSKGFHVDPSWLIFANFQKDVKSIPNWFLKIDYPQEYSLDKDILLASNRYSKETCMWASQKEQFLNESRNKPFSAVSPNGEVKIFLSAGDMASQLGISLSSVKNGRKGLSKQCHGWTNFKYLEPKHNKVIRYRCFDQLKSTISSIKHNPNSRRHIITLWNPSQIEEMRLPPCHGNIIQFYVSNGKLSCQMYQRSGDSLLGIGYNIASYALLTHIIAKIVGLQVGEFIHTIGNLHLYNNHREQAKLQLSRPFFPLPTLEISDRLKDIDDIKFEDFKLLNYKYHPSIKAEVAI